MKPSKMMPAVEFAACRIIAMRIESGDGDVEAAVKDVTERLLHLGVPPALVSMVVQQARERVEGDTELHRYQRLLATHDWLFNYSDDGRVFKAGSAERAVLTRMAAYLDPDHKLWGEYAQPDVW